MSIKNMLIKLIHPKAFDDKVDAINKESLKKIYNAAEAAKRQRDFLKSEDGVSMRIFIALGGDKHD